MNLAFRSAFFKSGVSPHTLYVVRDLEKHPRVARECFAALCPFWDHNGIDLYSNDQNSCPKPAGSMVS